MKKQSILKKLLLTDAKVIAVSLDRHVYTVKCFFADQSPKKKRSESGTLKAVSTSDIRSVKRQLLKKPEKTSKTIFKAINLPEVPKSTRCLLLKNLAKNVTPDE